MKINYLIKYTVMPLYIQRAYSDSVVEKNYYSADSYIVTKCYVVSEEKKYNKLGDYQRFYKIVFPYYQENYWQMNECFFTRREPVCDENDNCINSFYTKEVFDTYEEAKELSDRLNYHSLAVSNNREMTKFFQDKCKQLEKDMMLGTGYLKTWSSSSKQEIIMDYNEGAYILPFSIYDYIEGSFGKVNDFPVVAYTVPKRTFNKMRDHALVYRYMTDEYKDMYKPLFMNIDDEGIKIFNNSKLKCDGHYHLMKNKIYFSEDKILIPNERQLQEYVKFYTTETFEDLLNSYCCNYLLGYSDISDRNALNSAKKKILKLEVPNID